MNFDRLRFVAERAELGEGREALLSVEIPERPGRQVYISRHLILIFIPPISIIALSLSTL